MNKEMPGAQTPWRTINQLLAPDERFTLHLPEWKGFLLAPKHPSQMVALLFFIQQEKIAFCVQGSGNKFRPTQKDVVVISPRSFCQNIWHPQGIVEVGGGCSISQLQQFLFERNQEVLLEGSPVLSPKSSMVGLILSGQTAGLRYRGESFSETILGVDLVTWEGGQVKWGGVYTSPPPGPLLHKLIWGLESSPGVVIKIILKTYPIPSNRLQLTWSYQQKEALWQQYQDLKQFSSSWEYLDVVLSAHHVSPSFIFAQISGLSEEMEAFSKGCPGYSEASQQGEKLRMKQYFIQQKLRAYCVSKDYSLHSGEYLWSQEWNPKAWLITDQTYDNERNIPVWKERFLSI